MYLYLSLSPTSTVYPATAITDLTAVDTAVKTLEYQMQAIKDRLRQEAEAIPKARVVISLFLSLRVSSYHLHLCQLRFLVLCEIL